MKNPDDLGLAGFDSPEEFRRYVTQLVRKIAARLFRHNPEAAEQLILRVLQEAWLSLSRGRFEVPLGSTREQVLQALDRYIAGIVARQVKRWKADRAREQWRQEALRLSAPDLDRSTDYMTPLDHLLASERSKLVEKVYEALDRLDEKSRTVLCMRFLCDMPFQRISEVLGVPLGTLHARAFRALNKLRQIIDDDFTALVPKGD